ncbi:hypothetical protein [Streptomyces lavendulae]|uniref:hypothetical protein n=1 Tax=Streptomyces lavendulae TaxID=1914 RepID=UPI00249FE377|nr:hypothetical protein [Streptomyces lavendulae]GLX22513.1 hypothetical protein Slala01_61570 [Streptomyces lavendulae subsp. lavendulae]GLX29996.1 hypothetical protein Slala02_58160 [Streptomyces lavendulae subsp. lavendulae]
MGSVGTPVYALLPVRTGAARAEAAALVQEAVRQLADQGIDYPADQLVDLVQSQATVTGLYDEGELTGCLVVHPGEDRPHWSRAFPGTGLLVSVVPPVPGRDDQAARLLTLWLADRAAQHCLEWIWWEVPAGLQRRTTLLALLRDLGWEDLPPVRRADGQRVTPLRLRADRRPAPTVAIFASADALPLPTVRAR